MLELNQFSKNNELDLSTNISLETIIIKPLQVYSTRRTITIEPVYTQEFELRLGNSSISPSTSNVDNDLDLTITIRSICCHYLCHLITSSTPTQIFSLICTPSPLHKTFLRH